MHRARSREARDLGGCSAHFSCPACTRICPPLSHSWHPPHPFLFLLLQQSRALAPSCFHNFKCFRPRTDAPCLPHASRRRAPYFHPVSLPPAPFPFACTLAHPVTLPLALFLRLAIRLAPSFLHQHVPPAVLPSLLSPSLRLSCPLSFPPFLLFCFYISFG